MNIIAELHTHVAFRDRLLAEYPEIDDETLADTLEGCTNLDEALIAALRDHRRDEATVASIKGQITTLRQRAERIQARADRTKAIVSRAMEEASIKKLSAPEFTASMRATGPHVVITDATLIPADFLVFPDPKPDKITIKKAIQDGAIVPGCELSNGGVTLSIRE